MRRRLAAAIAVAALVAAARVHASDPPAAAHPPAPAAAPPAAGVPKDAPPPTPAPKPRPSSPARVDEVMGRVRTLIAAYEKDVLPEKDTPAGAAARRTRPRTKAGASSKPRVELVWRATLVWPAELR
jgi:hypothetical protein